MTLSPQTNVPLEPLCALTRRNIPQAVLHMASRSNAFADHCADHLQGLCCMVMISANLVCTEEVAYATRSGGIRMGGYILGA